jgi:hypothetical protein
MNEIKFEKLMVRHASSSSFKTKPQLPTKIQFYEGVELIAPDPDSALAKMLAEGAKGLELFEVVIRRTKQRIAPSDLKELMLKNRRAKR